MPDACDEADSLSGGRVRRSVGDVNVILGLQTTAPARKIEITYLTGLDTKVEIVRLEFGYALEPVPVHNRDRPLRPFQDAFIA